MEKQLKVGEIEKSGGEFDGMNTAYVIGGALLLATFWASPAMGIMFAIALIVCAAVCAVVLMLACAIGFCDTFGVRGLKRQPVSTSPRVHAIR